MREVNGEDYCYFATLNNLQAQMLIPMLEEEKIEVVSMPMYFFGVTYSSAGKSSSKKLYIRYKNFEKAKKIYNDYFKN